AAGDLAWEAGAGARAVMLALETALSSTPLDLADIDQVAMKARLVDYGTGVGVTWIAPYTIVDGRAELAPSSEWTRAEEQLVQMGERRPTLPPPTARGFTEKEWGELGQLAARLGQPWPPVKPGPSRAELDAQRRRWEAEDASTDDRLFSEWWRRY